MKLPILITALFATASFALAEDIRLEDCPPAVQQTIQANLRDGKLDDVKVIKVEDRTLYVADVDLPNGEDVKVHINGEGKLLKTVEDLPPGSLPPAIAAAAEKIANGAKLDDIEKIVTDGVTTYRVEIDRKGVPDLRVIFDESGAVLSQKEEAKD